MRRPEADVEDYQTFDLDGGVASVEIVCFDGGGAELETVTVTPENPGAVICFDDGGQIFASRYLRFDWAE